MSGLIVQIIIGIIGLWLAVRFVPDVEFTGSIKILIYAGIGLGLINFFIKPILKKITLPLRTLTFGLFTLVINMGMVWIVDLLFPELIIKGLKPLFWVTVIIWILSLILPTCLGEKRTEEI